MQEIFFQKWLQSPHNLFWIRNKISYPYIYRCLDGQGWNLELARNAFIAAKEKNEIPPEAFS